MICKLILTSLKLSDVVPVFVKLVNGDGVVVVVVVVVVVAAATTAITTTTVLLLLVVVLRLN